MTWLSRFFGWAVALFALAILTITLGVVVLWIINNCPIVGFTLCGIAIAAAFLATFVR